MLIPVIPSRTRTTLGRVFASHLLAHLVHRRLPGLGRRSRRDARCKMLGSAGVDMLWCAVVLFLYLPVTQF